MFTFSAQEILDHPRRCGENLNIFAAQQRGWGSPPQVRGKPSCGVQPSASIGSPPQVRGKLRQLRQCSQQSGITPAGAGKTDSTADCGHSDWDHPRRCGENLYKKGNKKGWTGSPPQVRGKPDTADDAPSHERITPAGAGKTAAITIFAAVLWDHPRRCGEN